MSKVRMGVITTFVIERTCRFRRSIPVARINCAMLSFISTIELLRRVHTSLALLLLPMPRHLLMLRGKTDHRTARRHQIADLPNDVSSRTKLEIEQRATICQLLAL